MKMLQVKFRNGEVKEIPVQVIAANRAEYYSATDENTTYQEEYDFIMDDENEALDWFVNNMYWKDVEKEAVDVSKAEELDYSEEAPLLCSQ